MQSLNDLREFQRRQWRTLHPNPDEIAAIQEAIDDMENGDNGIPFDEFDREFRARRNLPHL